MKPNRHLLLTFDYELFLGNRSGTVANCMIRPTAKLLDILKKHGIRNALFFLDTACLQRMENNNDPRVAEDLRQIRQQLIRILREGHLVFPHLHPHWLDAEYIRVLGQWSLSNTSKYRFHNISSEQRDELFSYAIGYLEGVQREAGITYDIDAYRAGGWCLQPFSDFKPYFDRHGIRNDFSALRDFCWDGKILYYDYRGDLPNHQYRFDDVVRPDPNGKYTEYPISVLPMSKSDRLKARVELKFWHVLGVNSFGDGVAITRLKPFASGVGHALADSETVEMISVELLISTKLYAYKEFLRQNKYMHFMSHPKMFTPHNLRCFDRFLKHAVSKYQLISYYKNMVD